MNSILTTSILAFACLPAALLAGQGGGATAAAGPVSIDQARAEAGAVTAGDAAGFPVTLSRGGSYRLISNLIVTTPNVNAIQVTSDDVTIDLNGFSIVGQVVCSGLALQFVCETTSIQSHGVSADGYRTVVRNGSVRGFGYGVRVGDGSRVEDLHVTSTALGALAGGRGIFSRNVISGALTGISAIGTIRDNEVYNTRGDGIASWGEGYVVGNRVSFTGGQGILAYKANFGHAAVAHNRVSSSIGGVAISGGVSLGDGMSNLCQQVKC